MSQDSSRQAKSQEWDRPWYRVRTDRYEISFLPDANEDFDKVSNVDVLVRLADGSRWSATMFTVAEVRLLMESGSQSGESLGGRYFWCSDGLIVRDPGIDNMAAVIEGLIESGEFSQILQRLDDDDLDLDSA